MRPGCRAASVPNCSATISGAWFGSMMPPEPTRMVLRARGDMGQRDGGGAAGEAGHVVVLGHPEAPVAERLDMAGEVEGVAQRLAGAGALRDGGEVEDGEGQG